MRGRGVRVGGGDERVGRDLRGVLGGVRCGDALRVAGVHGGDGHVGGGQPCLHDVHGDDCDMEEEYEVQDHFCSVLIHHIGHVGGRIAALYCYWEFEGVARGSAFFELVVGFLRC